MMEITAGVLGAGRIGRIHLRNLARMPGVRLKTVADPFVALDLENDAPTIQVSDPEALLVDEEIDAVVISSPTPTHADFIERAARAGKHIFCEKPIDLEPERVKALVRLLESEQAAYDIGAYRDAPAGLRIWCGATIESQDLKSLLPWISWAYRQVSGA